MGNSDVPGSVLSGSVAEQARRDAVCFSKGTEPPGVRQLSSVELGPVRRPRRVPGPGGSARSDPKGNRAPGQEGRVGGRRLRASVLKSRVALRTPSFCHLCPELHRR